MTRARPGRQAHTDGETYSTIAIAGSAARTRRAMPRVKPGLSMTTRTCGRFATTALAVKRIRRRILGMRRGMALNPMMGRSLDGEGVVTPSARLSAPADAGKGHIPGSPLPQRPHQRG